MGSKKTDMPMLMSNIYKEYFEDIFKKIGIHDYIQTSYLKLQRVRYSFFMTDMEVSISDTKCRFVINSKADYERIVRLEYGDQPLERILDEIEPDDVFWDIGANIGTHTLFPAKAASNGSVVAIEANDRNYQSLQMNIRKNKITNISTEDVALSDHNGTEELAISGHNLSGEGSHSIERKPTSESTSVTTVTGDSLLERYSSPNIVRMDIEGAELNALRGMTDALKKTRLISLEVHEQYVEKEKIYTLLESTGFEISVIEDEGSLQEIIAVREE